MTTPSLVFSAPGQTVVPPASAGSDAAAIDSRRQPALLSAGGLQPAVLEERRRLARELHDSVTQSLVSMSLLAQVVPDLWEIDPAEARRSLVQLRDLTVGALAEMRALLIELRPPGDGESDLPGTLRQHVAAFERRTTLAVAADLPAAVSLPDPVAHALGRIAQEALTNIARHARASRVSLRLYASKVRVRRSDCKSPQNWGDLGGPAGAARSSWKHRAGERPLRLVIADDGRGFDPDAVGAGSLGLISMRERAAGIGARLQIDSAPGRGTTIIVEWPGPGAEPAGGGA